MSSTVTNYSNKINSSYPVPGVDNDTQGFRDNFANIKNALQATAQELSYLDLNTAKLNTGTNDYGYSGVIFRAPFKGSGNVTTVEKTINSSTNISFLLGNYQKFLVNNSANISFTDWPIANIHAEILLEFKNYSPLTTATVLLNVPNLKKSVGVQLPIRLEPSTSDNNPIIYKVWTTDAGATVFLDKILDTDTNLAPFLYDPENVDSAVATAIFANSATTATFATTAIFANSATTATFATTVLGSTQPNITTLGILTDVKVGSATIKYSDPNLIISGISGLTIETNNTISKILTDWSGGSGSLSTINTLTFTSITGIDLGDTFKLWPAETTTHVVKSINTFTNQITTDPFNSTEAVTSGSVGDGSSITFYKGLLYNSVYYATSAPATAIGQTGDRRGAIYSNSATIYVCYANFDGVNPIWAKVTTTPW
jgi:hypothetical protein